MKQFELTEEQERRIQEWLHNDIYPKIMAIQKETLGDNFQHLTDDGKYPYYGAIGGELSYIFCPTSLGVIITVKESITKKELDVTDYNNF